MRALLLVAVLGLPALAVAEAAENATLSPDGRLRLWTEHASFSWPEHPFFEAVCFHATNVDRERLHFAHAPPFSHVTGPAGAEYDHHGAFTASLPLDPGETYTRCWGEADPEESGQETLGPYLACSEPGDYTFTLHYPDASIGPTQLVLPFSLRGPLAGPEPALCPVGDSSGL